MFLKRRVDEDLERIRRANQPSDASDAPELPVTPVTPPAPRERIGFQDIIAIIIAMFSVIVPYVLAFLAIIALIGFLLLRWMS